MGKAPNQKFQPSSSNGEPVKQQYPDMILKVKSYQRAREFPQKLEQICAGHIL
jgi:hypothetical protein